MFMDGEFRGTNIGELTHTLMSGDARGTTLEGSSLWAGQPSDVVTQEFHAPAS